MYNPNEMLQPFTNRSFVLNWVYWRLYRGGLTGEAQWNYIVQAFNDDMIWSSHKKELKKFITFARQIDSEIEFIVWPYLTDIERSFDFTSRVVSYLVEQEVKVIDLTTHLRGREPKDLIVSTMDPHPNKETNKEVADLVYKSLSWQN